MSLTLNSPYKTTKGSLSAWCPDRNSSHGSESYTYGTWVVKGTLELNIVSQLTFGLGVGLHTPSLMPLQKSVPPCIVSPLSYPNSSLSQPNFVTLTVVKHIKLETKDTNTPN